VNQTVLQQVRQIVAQMEAMGSETDTHAVASREILFMQLLVLLRKSSLAEEATNNDARLNQLMAWLEDHFARRSAGRRWRRSFRRCVPCTAS
jgi:AraC family L-rhamnose operon regulatory protein RhaS